MNLNRILNFCCIIIGGLIALYAQAEEKQNQYILIIGIVLLMFGIYRISRGVPSKFENKKEESFVKEEKNND